MAEHAPDSRPDPPLAATQEEFWQIAEVSGMTKMAGGVAFLGLERYIKARQAEDTARGVPMDESVYQFAIVDGSLAIPIQMVEAFIKEGRHQKGINRGGWKALKYVHIALDERRRQQAG